MAVRLRTALASSLNAPAVHLLSRLGLREFLALGERLGFAFPPAAAGRYGLGAAVGNAGVTLAELTRAFSVFANRGLLEPLRTVRAVVTAGSEQVPYPLRKAPVRVLREETAWLVADILSDPAARATGFGVSARFNAVPRGLFKSGTSSRYESLWCLGATEHFTVGVWAGNLDGRPAFGTTGSSLPAAIALRALEAAAASEVSGGSTLSAAPVPRGLKPVRICTDSGHPASQFCPSTRWEYLPAEDTAHLNVSPASRTESCPLHGPRPERGFESLGGAERLLSALLAGPSGEPRILFPLPEQLFYRDRALAAQGQHLEAWIAAPPDQSLTFQVTGSSPEAAAGGERLSYPFRVALPLEPGTYRLEVSGSGGSDQVRYHVR